MGRITRLSLLLFKFQSCTPTLLLYLKKRANFNSWINSMPINSGNKAWTNRKNILSHTLIHHYSIASHASFLWWTSQNILFASASTETDITYQSSTSSSIFYRREYRIFWQALPSPWKEQMLQIHSAQSSCSSLYRSCWLLRNVSS